MESNKSANLKNRWVILLIVVITTFMTVLDGSIVNVALPTMSKKLSASMASIEWVVTSYLMVIVAVILIFGRLGDIKGKTTVFKFGVILFSIGSLLCGLSPNLQFLVISRVIQAIGAAGAMANSQGIITHVFPANERGKALGISGTFVALGNMVGAPLGGFIVDLLSWHYIFLINVPIGIILFVIGLRVFPKDLPDSKEKLDLSGAILFAISVIALFGAVTSGQTIGYDKPSIIITFVIAAIAFVAFLLLERKLTEPLLDLEIFKNKLFSISIFCGFISFIAISCVNIIQPFYLQDTLKMSSSAAGLFLMVSPIILSVVAPASGHLSDKIGSEFLTFIGLVLTSIGLLLLSTLNVNSSLISIIVFIGIMSLGNGLFQSPNNSLIMSTVPKSKLGIAGSINALIRNLGMVFGISFSTAILYNRMSSKIGYRVINYVTGRDDVFIYGMKVVYILAAVICAAGAIITALRMISIRKNKAAK